MRYVYRWMCCLCVYAISRFHIIHIFFFFCFVVISTSYNFPYIIKFSLPPHSLFTLRVWVCVCGLCIQMPYQFSHTNSDLSSFSAYVYIGRLWWTSYMYWAFSTWNWNVSACEQNLLWKICNAIVRHTIHNNMELPYPVNINKSYIWARLQFSKFLLLRSNQANRKIKTHTSTINDKTTEVTGKVLCKMEWKNKNKNQ